MRLPADARKRFLIIAAVLVVLALLFAPRDIRAVIELLIDTDWVQVAVATGLLAVGVVLMGVGWWSIVPGHPARWPTFHTSNVSYLLSIFSPLPHALLRVVATSAGTAADPSQVSAAMFVDRLLVLLLRLTSLVVGLALLAKSKGDTGPPTIVIAALIAAALGLLLWAVRNPGSAVARTEWLSNLPHLRDRHVDKGLMHLLRGMHDTVTARRLAAALSLYAISWMVCWVSYAMTLDAAPVSSPAVRDLAIAAILLAVVPPAAAAMFVVFQVVVVSVLVAGRITDPASATTFAIVLQLPQIILFTALGLLGSRRTGIGPRRLLRDARRDVAAGASEETIEA